MAVTQVCKMHNMEQVSAELLGFLIKYLRISNETSKWQVKTNQGQVLLCLKCSEAMGLWGF